MLIGITVQNHVTYFMYRVNSLHFDKIKRCFPYFATFNRPSNLECMTVQEHRQITVRGENVGDIHLSFVPSTAQIEKV